MEDDTVDEKVCSARMDAIHAQLSLIVVNTVDIKKDMIVIPLLCERVQKLEQWKDGFWKTVIATMLGAVGLFSGIVALIIRLKL